MERHLDAVHQRRDAVRDLRRRPRVEALQAERKSDERAEDTEAGHRARDLVQHVPVDHRVRHVVVDVVLDVALVVRLVHPLDARELIEIILELFLQSFVCEQFAFFPLTVLFPEELVRIHRILPDLLRDLLQVGDQVVQRQEAPDLTAQEDRADDQEHHNVHRNIRDAFLLRREHVQVHAHQDHHDVSDRQKPLIPFSVAHTVPPVYTFAVPAFRLGRRSSFT